VAFFSRIGLEDGDENFYIYTFKKSTNFNDPGKKSGVKNQSYLTIFTNRFSLEEVMAKLGTTSDLIGFQKVLIGLTQIHCGENRQPIPSQTALIAECAICSTGLSHE